MVGVPVFEAVFWCPAQAPVADRFTLLFFHCLCNTLSCICINQFSIIAPVVGDLSFHKRQSDSAIIIRFDCGGKQVKYFILGVSLNQVSRSFQLFQPSRENHFKFTRKQIICLSVLGSRWQKLCNKLGRICFYFNKCTLICFNAFKTMHTWADWEVVRKNCS